MTNEKLFGFTGDVFLGGSSPGPVFAPIGARFSADTTLFLNFEGTLFQDRSTLRAVRRKVSLESPVAALASLDSLPVGLACIGNNHIGDYGNGIATFTQRELKAKYPVFGAGFAAEQFQTTTFRHGDVKLGFASYCTADSSPLFCTAERIGPREFNLERARADLALLQRETDHCVAIMHWGDEDFHHPRADQRDVAQQLIRDGFSAVIGNHSHTAQGYERYRDGWIFYSLGNFFFPDHSAHIEGQSYSVQWMPRRSWGLVPQFNISRQGFELKHVNIVEHHRNGQPMVRHRSVNRLRLAFYCAALRSPSFSVVSRCLRKAESLPIRIEEFGNHPNKTEAMLKRLRRLVGRAAA